MEVAVEAKAARKITADHLRGLRHLHADHPEVKSRIVVCQEAKERRTEDGIRILLGESTVIGIFQRDVAMMGKRRLGERGPARLAGSRQGDHRVLHRRRVELWKLG